MLKMSRTRAVFFAGLLVLIAGPRCFSQQSESQWLISPKLLKHANLKIAWQYEMPMKKKEKLDRFFMLGDSIYAFSNKNYMVSLNRKNSKLIFTRTFLSNGSTLLGMELHKDKLISIMGNKLVEIDPKYGTDVGSERIGYGVTCPATRNSSFFYIAGSDNRLRALRASDKVKIFEAAAENDSAITSIVAGDDVVAFSTQAGNVVCITPDEPKKLWQFDAADAIVGPIVRDGKYLYVASRDAYVYKLNVRAGRTPVWKHQTAALLDKAPQITRDILYQYVHHKGLSAIDKKTGRFLWQAKGGLDLLAEAGKRAYVLTDAGTLVVMDNKKRKQLYSVNFAGVSKYATNTTDSRIYVADDAGRIACLQPIK